MMKSQYQTFTQTSHIVHCTQTADSANVKVQNILHGRNEITCSAECKIQNSCNTVQNINPVCLEYIIVNRVHKGEINYNKNNIRVKVFQLQHVTEFLF
jgi:hypothetical protein